MDKNGILNVINTMNFLTAERSNLTRIKSKFFLLKNICISVFMHNELS
jgi:hypothetical protein